MFGRMDTFVPLTLLPSENNGQDDGDFFERELDMLLGRRNMNDLSDPFDFIDAMINDMVGMSMKLFDEALTTPVRGEHHEEEGQPKESVAEQTAERALDYFVASFAQRATSSSSDVPDDKEDEDEREEEAPERHVTVENLAGRLADVGADIMAHTRRRLSEGDEDPHAPLKERLARRLTEYETDMFLYPDGSITMYTRSLPSIEDSKRDKSIPILGLGSHEMDECIYSHYKKAELSGGCSTAVTDYLDESTNPPSRRTEIRNTARNTATISKENIQTHHHPSPRIVTFSKRSEGDQVTYVANICLESLVLALSILSVVSCVTLCTGFVDVLNLCMSSIIFISTVCFGFGSLLVTIPLILIMDCFLRLNDEDEDEEGQNGAENDKFETGGHACNYTMLNDDEGDAKEHETRVFIGIPVQVV